MSTTYVAIDVETTGFDPKSEALIEVAAITFRDADILDEYSSLVNPQRDIPPFITSLTGISQEMVDDAPTIFSVRSQLRPKLGDHILIGHNVSFDLAFLQVERLAQRNPHLDTLTLATILFPQAGRYGLEAIAEYLHLPLPPTGQAHRALADAELTVELFLALRDKALTLQLSQLDELVRAGRKLDWPETLFFEDILQVRAKRAFEEPELRHQGRHPQLYNPPRLAGRPLVPAEKPVPLDPEIVAGMISPGGNFSRAFPNFEHRPQQVEMLLAVTDAFNFGDHVMVEAGTGTGKSVAYLIPAAFWAQQNGRPVIISTNTINLQDQLINKDIPELQNLLPFELRAAVRKGRRNYLCTRLFQQMRHTGPNNDAEMALYARILLWLPGSETGDVAELTLRTPAERLVWSRVNAENSSCTYEHCASANCPLHHARQRAELAHLIIVNHSLLLADIAREGSTILPEFVDVIVDEAHHLEAAVTDGLSFRAEKRFFDALLDEVNKTHTGLLTDLQNRVKNSLPPEFGSEFDKQITSMRREGQGAAVALEDFFQSIAYFLAEAINKRSKFAQQVRLVPAVRHQPGFDTIELNWENLNNHLQRISAGFGKLASGLADISESFDIDDEENLRLTLMSTGQILEETRANLDAIIMDPQDDIIYWVEVYRERLSLHAAPLHVGPLVERNIFHAMETVVLTSATLRTASPYSPEEPDFRFIQDRLHAHDVNNFAVGSPFDYENQTLLYLVTDIPEPNQPGYQRMVEEAIIDVATALGGRTMVLFTAYSQLSQTARAIEERLNSAGIATLVQSSGSSRQQLLEQFKRPDSHAVLLGTRSFWEGVDVPGDALQAVLIAKLPFDVPSDPIFAARSETFENAFFEYSVPEAVLRFRQGFGRLNRRITDQGVVVILDKRVLTKRYGQMFLQALPECTVLRQKHQRLGELTLRWLNRGQ